MPTAGAAAAVAAHARTSVGAVRIPPAGKAHTGGVIHAAEILARDKGAATARKVLAGAKDGATGRIAALADEADIRIAAKASAFLLGHGTIATCPPAIADAVSLWSAVTLSTADVVNSTRALIQFG